MSYLCHPQSSTRRPSGPSLHRQRHRSRTWQSPCRRRQIRRLEGRCRQGWGSLKDSMKLITSYFYHALNFRIVWTNIFVDVRISRHNMFHACCKTEWSMQNWWASGSASYNKIKFIKWAITRYLGGGPVCTSNLINCSCVLLPGSLPPPYSVSITVCLDVEASRLVTLADQHHALADDLLDLAVGRLEMGTMLITGR